MKFPSILPVLAAALLSMTSYAAESVSIRMKSISYEPKQIEISEGQSVIWKNVSYTDHSAASVTGDPASFDTGMIAPGKESKPVRFEVSGTYNYHCDVHGKSMSGVIIVKAGESK